MQSRTEMCCSYTFPLAAACCAALASFSICSIFSNVMDLIGMIFGLHRTSLKFPFSLYTNPALGNTSLNTFRPPTILCDGFFACGCMGCFFCNCSDGCVVLEEDAAAAVDAASISALGSTSGEGDIILSMNADSADERMNGTLGRAL